MAPGWTLRPRRFLLLFCLLVVAALVVSTVSYGARNQPLEENFAFGEIYNGSPSQDCWRHHLPEGMYDSHVIVPLFPAAIKKLEATPIELQIENAWKNEIAAYQVFLNLSQAPGIVSLGGQVAESEPPLLLERQGRLGNARVPNAIPGQPVRPDAYNNITFDVKNGAVALIAQVDLLYPPGVENLPTFERVEAFYYPPDVDTGRKFDGENTDASRNFSLPRGDINAREEIFPGTWRIELGYTQGDSRDVEYRLKVTVAYRAAGSGVHIVVDVPREPPEGPNPTILAPPRGVIDVPPLTILGIEDGPQTVRVEVRVLLYYKHDAGGTPNEDFFRRVADVPIVVGNEFVAFQGEGVAAGSLQIDLFLEAGEITGFASAFLLVPSLLFGGTYGRGSRKLFNHLLGGAKRRVMFHNLMSLGLTLLALVHILLFLLEVRYSILMGVLFGGLASLSLLVLGLTGYYQVPLIQKYGYNWWRYTHLVFGLVVVVFVAYHGIADGDDFFFIKEQLPQWINELNLAQK